MGKHIEFLIWEDGKKQKYVVFATENLHGGKNGKGVGTQSPPVVTGAKLKENEKRTSLMKRLKRQL